MVEVVEVVVLAEVEGQENGKREERGRAQRLN